MQPKQKPAPPLADAGILSMLRVSAELLWVLLCSIPIILHALYTTVFPGEGKNLRGKIVLVTGAANGLGKEISLQLSKLGCRVACVDIMKNDNDDTARQIIENTGNSDSAKSYTCDVSDINSTAQLANDVLRDFGHVDILVNNAGIIYSNGILDGDDRNIKRVVDVNLMGSYWMTRAFLPQMQSRNEGHVVFINSMASLTPVARGSIYCVAKFGLLGLALSLNEEMRKDNANIKITSAHPYFISTDGWYTKDLFVTRVKPMPTSFAARQIITGIRREYLTFQVPGYETGFWFSCFLRILPRKLYSMLADVMQADLNVPDSDKVYKNIHLKASS